LNNNFRLYPGTFPLQSKQQTLYKMSSLSFTFVPSLVPAYAQADFLSRFFQLVVDYQTLTAPAPPAPNAEDLPLPTGFVPVEGDGAEDVVRPEPAADKPLEQMTGQELRDRLADLTGKPRGRRSTGKFSNKELLIAEIRRLEAAAADSAPEMPARTPNSGGANLGRFDAPAAVAETDAASDSSSKKVRKNPWADLTPEQRAAKIAAMRAGREAKKAASVAATNVTNGSA
jgi:hypothetical protein